MKLYHWYVLLDDGAHVGELVEMLDLCVHQCVWKVSQCSVLFVEDHHEHEKAGVK